MSHPSRPAPTSVRLDQTVLDELDRAVAAGAAPTRHEAIRAAIKLWLLDTHDNQ